ncbi:hypothetical protein [Streptomyces sp. NPDC002209]|uniref:hypothetical protein n=1 Tax=Streptomyces sp. NPDC002209 TaxID=3364638 RepID=UPI003699AA05
MFELMDVVIGISHLISSNLLRQHSPPKTVDCALKLHVGGLSHLPPQVLLPYLSLSMSQPQSISVGGSCELKGAPV